MNGVEVVVVVEVDDKGLVLRIAGFDEGERRGVYLQAFVAHASAIVDHQAHADGHVFLPKHGDFLLGFIFENPERVLL